MIRLIVSDVDGTLVPEGSNELKPEFFSVIRQLKEQGIYFAVASGRHKSSIKKLFDPVKEDIFYITNNGAYLGTLDKCLYVSSLQENVYQKLFEDFNQIQNTAYLAESIDHAYTASKDSEFIRLLTEDYNYNLTFKDSMKNFPDDIIKLSLYHPVDVKSIDEKLLKIWNNFSKCSISGLHWIDFMNQNTNKGIALIRLQEILGITIQETAAFGDQRNDIEMLKQAYFSFATQGADCTVKNAARFTCDACEDDGVLKMLRRLLPTAYKGENNFPV